MYGFLPVCNSNFVPLRYDFEKCRDLEIRVKGLTVIGTDTDRSATYDFLFTFHGNHWPISHRFRDGRRLQSKIANFANPLYFAPPLTGFTSELDIDARYQKTRVIRLLGRTRSLTISSAVWIQYTNVTIRQMDTRRRQRPRLRIASRGKKPGRQRISYRQSTAAQSNFLLIQTVLKESSRTGGHGPPQSVSISASVRVPLLDQIPGDATG